jgi:protein phosphatase
LVHLANLRGGSDNITVVIARAGELPDGLPSEELPAAPDQESGPNWWVLASTWAIAATFVAAVSVALAGKPVEAVILGALVLAGILALGTCLWDRRPRRTADRKDLAETTVWRPYRTASAKFNPKFLTHLAAVEAELQRTATEEGWSINWPDHETAFNAAKNAIQGRQYRQAFRHYARAIDVLMCGVHLQRKQMNREAKWGKSPSSPAQEPA